MENLEYRIKEIEEEMQDLEIKIDSFSLHGRSPRIEERFIQLSMLKEWADYNVLLNELKLLI